MTILLNNQGEVETDQCKEDEEAGDVADHSSQRDLKRTEHLERRHQVRCASDADDVGDGEQHVGHYLGVVRLPLEPSCTQKLGHKTPVYSMGDV